MIIRFNVNYKVRVKVTDFGKECWKKYHQKLRMETPPIREDKDGWSEWQLWDLMATFGPYIMIGNEVPFETQIELVSE